MLDFGRIKKNLSLIVLLFIIAFLCWALDGALTGSPITKDARQNLQAAYNICTWGVFSIESAALEKPPADNYREPLAPFVTSCLVRLYRGFDSGVAFEDLSRGKLCRAVKKINLFWALLLLLGSAVLVVAMTRSTIFAALSVCLIYASFLKNPEYIDTIGTEIPTAAIMVWASVLLVRSVRSGGRVLFICAGLLLGLLALTKAVFLYLAVPIVLVVLLCAFTASPAKKIRALSLGMLFAAGIAVAVAPWMVRNYIHLGSFTLTLRGGAVLYGRTLRNSMNMDEVVGAFYLWGPGAYKKMVKNSFLDMRSEDYEEGGRAARLNRSADSNFAHKDALAEQAGKPQDAISFHSQGRAERERLIRQFALQGHRNPQQAADSSMQHEARRRILAQPLRHVMMTIPFAWRGIWCFYGGGMFTVLNALCAFAFMALAVHALLTGRQRIIAFLLLPFSMLFFNAFLTHNLCRYSSPAIPHMVISLFVIIAMLAGRNDGRPSTRALENLRAVC